MNEVMRALFLQEINEVVSAKKKKICVSLQVTTILGSQPTRIRIGRAYCIVCDYVYISKTNRRETERIAENAEKHSGK